MQIWNVGRIFYVLGYGYMLCVLCVCVYVCLQCASVPVRLCVFVCVCVNLQVKHAVEPLDKFNKFNFLRGAADTNLAPNLLLI